MAKTDEAVLRYHGAVPVYRSDRAPEGLLTRRQLRAAGLSAAGLRPAAYLHYSPHHGVCELFDREAARPVRPLTERQREILAAGRLLAGTSPCQRCGERTKWSSADWEERGNPVCRPCLPALRAAQKKKAAERYAAERQAFERMLAKDRAAAADWAREVLADPQAVVIDAETTGLLGDHPFVVQLAVVTVGGDVLLDTLVNPQMPIPQASTFIHGITDGMVESAPVFDAVLGQLTEALRGRRVIGWSAPFDAAVIRNELVRYFEARTTPAPVDEARPWMGEGVSPEVSRQSAEWLRAFLVPECAMERYAEWFGEWDEYHESYTWQRLNGPHSACGDCEAVVERLRLMSQSQGHEAAPVAAVQGA
ncbi:exonuclease domain-containing protein [Streptomyces sp. NPDC058758]|uniref:exonuclease domain-containing protein n=1 Tax=Streptomyces sp. NPDC058758 TaxID=3346627 RepID=UPI003690C4C9